MEVTYSTEISVDFNGLHGVIFWKIELFIIKINTAVDTNISEFVLSNKCYRYKQKEGKMRWAEPAARMYVIRNPYILPVEHLNTL
jgi:hypothetical protein